MPSIAVIGGLMTDFIVQIARFPKLGESLDGTSMIQMPGGKGGNAAVAAYRASHFKTDTSEEEDAVRVYMNGAVGRDEQGKKLKRGLQEDGVYTTGVIEVEGASTGTCIVIVEEGSGESGNIGVPGANASYRLPSSLEDLAGGRKPDLIILTLAEVPREEVAIPLLSKAREEGIDVLLNASLADVEVKKACSGVKHLILNESEAVAWSGVEGVSTTEGSQEAVDALMQKGVEHVVMTLGKGGAFYSSKERGEGYVNGVQATEVRDTTGAGDCFLGAYAVQYVQQKARGEWDIQKAVSFACKAAAKSVEKIGCQSALPWADEIE